MRDMNKQIPFALPDICDEEISQVVESMRSGWLTTGPKTKIFEGDFSNFVGGGVRAVAVNSATAGLHLVLEAIGISAGDHVITTPYTFTATAEIIRYLGADPIFVDIDYDTFNIDPNEIEAAVERKRKVKGGQGAIKAIIPVHFAGLACDMDSIMRMAEREGMAIVEDAAHALPTKYKGGLIGSLATTATVYSFYATKTITTGEGGMIVTRDEGIAKRCREMRLHGISRDVYERYTSVRGDWRYEVIAPGYKYNMTDIAAGMGISQLKKAWSFQEKRAAMASVYDREFSELPLDLPPRPANDYDTHAWHLYVVRLRKDAPVSRDRFIELMAEREIGCSVHFIPLHIHPYWRDRYNYRPEEFPNALKAYESAVSLPLYTKMTESDQARVVEAVRDILR